MHLSEVAGTETFKESYPIWGKVVESRLPEITSP